MNEHEQHDAEPQDTQPLGRSHGPSWGGPGAARPGGLRIGDAEREDAVRRLGEHFAAGRLSDEEHAERIDAAYAARTQADLNHQFGDLPGEQAAEQAATQGPDAGPPWAANWGPGTWGPPWAQRGWGPQGQQGPGWPAAAGRCGNPALRWLALPFVLLAGLVVVGAVAHGFFFPGPAVPLLAIAALIFFFNGGFRRFRGGQAPWSSRPR